jgi:hypothetical protein
VKSIGWKATSMPMVFWSVPTTEWTGDPHIAEGMEAEVELPNRQTVVVDNVHYQGINNSRHRFQGQLSPSGKPSPKLELHCPTCNSPAMEVRLSPCDVLAFPNKWHDPAKASKSLRGKADPDGK